MYSGYFIPFTLARAVTVESEDEKTTPLTSWYNASDRCFHTLAWRVQNAGTPPTRVLMIPLQTGA